MNTCDSKRLVIALETLPPTSADPLAKRIVTLLDHGWDVHLVCQTKREPQDDPLGLFRRLEIEGRLHVAGSRYRPSFGALRVSISLLKGMLKNPRSTSVYLAACREDGLSLAETLRTFVNDAQLVELEPDLVHFESASLAADRMHLKRRLGCPIVVSLHGCDLNSELHQNQQLLAQIWDRADAIHLFCKASLPTAVTKCRPTKSLTALIPRAVDLEHVAPFKAELNTGAKSALRIVSVGRLDWTQGLEYSLLAIRQLIDHGIDCQYRIVGDGEFLEALAFARFDLGLNDNVVFCGALSPDETLAELGGADVFLSSAVSPAACNSVVEAQAMALPAVCSDASGLPSAVAHGLTGFVVPRRNPAALAEKLVLLAGDPQLRLRMGKAGRKRAGDQHRVEDQVLAFERLYRETLDPNGLQTESLKHRSPGVDPLVIAS